MHFFARHNTSLWFKLKNYNLLVICNILNHNQNVQWVTMDIIETTMTTNMLFKSSHTWENEYVKVVKKENV